MSDFSLSPQHTVIFGMTGSGKTTLVIKYLLNDDSAACRFIFDDLNRMWPRLKIPACYSEKELRASLATKWSAFNPLRTLAHFGGDMKKAFRWWCAWVFAMSGTGPGKKMVVIPEVWRHCNPDSIPPELALLVQAGRELNVEVIADTQRPEMLNGSIVGAATEIICFRQMSPAAMRVTENLLRDGGNAFDPAQLRSLPLGSFVGFNRLSGGSLAGKVF
jgi:hypothetical protein